MQTRGGKRGAVVSTRKEIGRWFKALKANGLSEYKRAQFRQKIEHLRVLEKVHEACIIHGGIKPHNILVEEGTLAIRLIDFISAVDVRDVNHFIYDRSFVRDTLA